MWVKWTFVSRSVWNWGKRIFNVMSVNAPWKPQVSSNLNSTSALTFQVEWKTYSHRILNRKFRQFYWSVHERSEYRSKTAALQRNQSKWNPIIIPSDSHSVFTKIWINNVRSFNWRLSLQTWRGAAVCLSHKKILKSLIKVQSKGRLHGNSHWTLGVWKICN